MEIHGIDKVRLEAPDEETPHRDNRARQEASVRQMIYGVCGVVLLIAAAGFALIWLARMAAR